jgi:hypothetical protein
MKSQSQLAVVTAFVFVAALSSPNRLFAEERFWTGTTTGPHNTWNSSTQTQRERSNNGVSWNTEHSTISEDGTRGWNGTATGNAQRTNNGGSWTRNSAGENKKGNKWSTDSSGNWTKNEDGSYTSNKESTITGPKGGATQVNKESTLRKTEQGWSWDSNKGVTGPKGQTRTTSTSGNSEKTDQGWRWNTDRTHTGPRGTSTSQTSGDVIRKGKGAHEVQGTTRWTGPNGNNGQTGFSGSRVRDGNHINRTWNSDSAEQWKTRSKEMKEKRAANKVKWKASAAAQKAKGKSARSKWSKK